MPKVRPINSGRDVVNASSLGRQQINAPAAAFGTGNGLERLGSGLNKLGANVEQVERRNDAYAEQERANALKVRDEQNNLRRDRAMLNYNQKMNFYLENNQERKDYDKNLSDYDKFRATAMQKAMEESGMTDPNDVERFSITLGRSTMGYDLSMTGSANKIRKAEENAIRQTRYDEEKKKLLNSTDQLEGWAQMPSQGGSAVMDWYETAGAGFIDAMNSIAEQYPNKELADKARKDMLLDLGAGIVDSMSNKIAEHPEPEAYTDLVRYTSDSLLKHGVFDKGMKKKADEMIDKKLNARITKDQDRQKQWSSSVVDSYISQLLDDTNNIAEKDVILQDAKGMQARLATVDDLDGSKAVRKIENVMKTITAERNSTNYLAALEAFFTGGTDLMKKKIEEFEEGVTYKDQDGKTKSVAGLNIDQSIKLRTHLEKSVNAEAAGVAKAAIARLRKMSDDGKLYWMQYEERGGAPNKLYEYTPFFAAKKLLRDDEFERLDVEVGESAGFFNRGMPIAADWDQHQISGQDFDKLADLIMQIATDRNIKDPAVLDMRIKQILIPTEKEAALKAFDNRMRTQSAASKKFRVETLNTVVR